MILAWGGLRKNRPHLYRERNEAIIQAGIEHPATEPIDSYPQHMRSHLNERELWGKKRERERERECKTESAIP